MSLQAKSGKGKSVHVFASDFLPYPGCPRTAGGNRSMQVISALREAGHHVTFSMPLTNYLGKKNASQVLASFNEEEIWSCENFFEPNIVLNRIQPDIAIFCNINMFRTVARFSSEIVQVVDCYGPLQFESLLIDAPDYEAAMRDGPLLEERCQSLVSRMRHIDYLLTVSERQKYFWAAYCTLAGFSFDELDIRVCPAAFQVPQVARATAATLTVVYSGGFYPWQSPDRFLQAAASLLEKIDGATLHIFGGPHLGLPNVEKVQTLLESLQQFRCVRYHGYRPIEELTATLATAWCALELMERNIERELAITGRTIEFLSAGTPVIYNDYSTLSQSITGYKAGWTVSVDDPVPGLTAVFEELIQQGPSLVDELSRNARRLAATEFDPKRCMAPLVELCDGELKKRHNLQRGLDRALAFKNEESIGRVLAISPDDGALRDLRVSNPLRALQRQGLISGSKVTDPWFNTLKDDPTLYNSIFIQRAVPTFIYEMLNNLSLPFVLDIDDNLLARAEYRRHGKPETEVVVGLRYCACLTVPNPRLCKGLEKYSGLSLTEKTFVVPNSLPFPREYPARASTQPTQILWIQSDIAALSRSRAEVIGAVEEFSRKHRLPVTLIGRNVLDGPHFTNQVVMGEIDFITNLQILQFMPTSIGVAPLETDGHEETLDFVAGKSDLKILLFAGYGHPGVYSAAPPYTDSSLQSKLSLVKNTHSEWLNALEYQFEEGWRQSPNIALAVQSERSSDYVARESWMAALRSCVLPRPIRGSDLYRAFEASSKMNKTPASRIAYLAANQDVLNHWLDADLSAENHYAFYGQYEARRILHSAEAQRQVLTSLERESDERFGVAEAQLQKLREFCSKDRALALQQDEVNKLRHVVSALETEAGKSRQVLTGVLNSRSWHLTAPLRILTERFRR